MIYGKVLLWDSSARSFGTPQMFVGGLSKRIRKFDDVQLLELRLCQMVYNVRQNTKKPMKMGHEPCVQMMKERVAVIPFM